MNRIIQLNHFILICMALILLAHNPVFAQSNREKSWLEAFPVSSRERLLKRLKLYVEYERKQEYEKLYELFSESTIKQLYPKDAIVKTKGDYIKLWRRTPYPILLKFKPLSSNYDASRSEYEIRGQAELRWKGGVNKQEMFIYGALKNDEWYFSELLYRWDEIYSPEPVKTTVTEIIESLPPQ